MLPTLLSVGPWSLATGLELTTRSLVGLNLSVVPVPDPFPQIRDDQKKGGSSSPQDFLRAVHYQEWTAFPEFGVAVTETLSSPQNSSNTYCSAFEPNAHVTEPAVAHAAGNGKDMG